MIGAVGEDRFKGKGISYCATCDGDFFQDKEIQVFFYWTDWNFTFLSSAQKDSFSRITRCKCNYFQYVFNNKKLPASFYKFLFWE